MGQRIRRAGSDIALPMLGAVADADIARAADGRLARLRATAHDHLLVRPRPHSPEPVPARWRERERDEWSPSRQASGLETRPAADPTGDSVTRRPTTRVPAGAEAKAVGPRRMARTARSGGAKESRGCESRGRIKVERCRQRLEVKARAGRRQHPLRAARGRNDAGVTRGADGDPAAGQLVFASRPSRTGHIDRGQQNRPPVARPNERQALLHHAVGRACRSARRRQVAAGELGPSPRWGPTSDGRGDVALEQRATQRLELGQVVGR